MLHRCDVSDSVLVYVENYEGGAEMWFLVDYENVRESCFNGIDYLESEDSVVLFYSSACPTVRARYWNQLTASGCRLETYKLEKTGKNALDFCISTKVGEIFGSGYIGTVAILSGDKGYSAVADYWSKKSGKRVVMAIDFLKGILNASGDSRTRLARQEQSKVSIETVAAKYDVIQQLRNALRRTLDEKDAEMAIGILEAGLTPTDCYRTSLKRFGKEKGTQVYRVIKRVRR